MPGGFIERMERIADHLGDGWVIENLAVEPGEVGATVQYAHDSERCICWTAGPDGQRVVLRGADGCAQTWLDMDDVHVRRAADAIQDCAWFVEQDLTPIEPSVTVTDETPTDTINSFDIGTEKADELPTPSLSTGIEDGAIGQLGVGAAMSDGRENPDERSVFHHHHKKFKL